MSRNPVLASKLKPSVAQMRGTGWLLHEGFYAIVTTNLPTARSEVWDVLRDCLTPVRRFLFLDYILKSSTVFDLKGCRLSHKIIQHKLKSSCGE